jgi:hypothetical protein
VVETALATVVLITVLLGGRALLEMRAQELGYDVRDLQSARLHLAGSAHEDSPSSIEFARDLAERVATRTGEAAGVIGPSMLARSFSHQIATPVGMNPGDPASRFRVHWISIVPGTLAALGIDLREGRALEWGESHEGRVAMVIGQEVADRFWPGQSGVGQLLHLNGSSEPNAVVVGVAEPTQHSWRSNRRYTLGTAYFSLEQMPTPSLTLLWRAGQGAPGVGAIREIVQSIDPGVALYDIAPMSARLRVEEGSIRLLLGLGGVYGVIAVFLVLGGLIAFIAVSTHARTTELAVRRALGAGEWPLAFMVARGTLAHLLLGVGLGAGVAALLLRPLADMLYRVSPLDPVAYLGAAGVLLALGCCAAILQARMGVRREPATVIRAGS